MKFYAAALYGKSECVYVYVKALEEKGGILLKKKMHFCKNKLVIYVKILVSLFNYLIYFILEL